MKLRKKCCVKTAVTLTFSDVSCKNSRIRGRIRSAHNGTGAVGKSTVIAVETNRHDYYGRIQTETLPTAGSRTSQQLLFYSGLFIATLAFGYATRARVLGRAHLGRGQFVAAMATPKSAPHSGATLMGA